MHWELWHRKSGNMIDDFDTLSDGLAFVAEELAAGGHTAVLEWELLSSEEGVPPLQDQDLALTALVAQGNSAPLPQTPTPIAELVARRFQDLENQVRELQKQLAAARSRTA